MSVLVSALVDVGIVAGVVFLYKSAARRPLMRHNPNRHKK